MEAEEGKCDEMERLPTIFIAEHFSLNWLNIENRWT